MHYGKLRKTLIISLFVVLGLSLSIYSYYQAKNFLSGPQITITSPLSGSTFEDPLVSIEGSATNIARITLNDRQIFVDENGRFSEKLLLLEGYNIITVHVKDKFDREIEKTLELVLLEDLPLQEVEKVISTESLKDLEN